ncbi:MAG: hypothetical protein K0S61_1283 [Anaerocolumna sp.]|nr:hypothetical protein [Anaerocolumna sp.]
MSLNNSMEHINDLVVETSFVYDFISYGETKPINYINPDNIEDILIKEEGVLLFTEGNPVNVLEDFKRNWVAVVVDSNMTVTMVINKDSGEGVTKAFDETIDFTIADDSFVIIGYDMDYEKSGIHKFFAEKFKSGDIIKLKINDKQVSIQEVLLLSKHSENMNASLSLLTKEIYTTVEKEAKLQGFIDNPGEYPSYHLHIKKFNQSGELVFNIKSTIIKENNYRFSEAIQLEEGVNYIDVDLFNDKDEKILYNSTKNIIIFRKSRVPMNNQKHTIMWVEQFVNAKALNSVEKMELMINTAKDAGITEFALDVKGCEGFTAYKKATLSNAPYMTATIDPKKQVDMDIDFLEEFIKIAHNADMKVYASINFFVEGNISTGDYAINVPKVHPEWAEILQAPEDAGELKSVLDTKRDAMLLYVNPANDEVQEYQLRRAEEVLMNYEVDGIIMDRTRYDNQYADFSDVTRKKFETYLEEKNKKLINWPEDAYSIKSDGVMVLGEHYYEWITFRSTIIQGFSNRLRELIDMYREFTNRDIKLAAYVGSWYETYYQNGVNWADNSFVYNERLNFPMDKLYTRDYAKASYIKNIDFIMIGCYYDTKEQIEKYVTLGNILLNNTIDLIGSISLPDLKTAKELKEGFKATYENSDGTMIFDLCYTDWSKLTPALKG